MNFSTRTKRALAAGAAVIGGFGLRTLAGESPTVAAPTPRASSTRSRKKT